MARWSIRDLLPPPDSIWRCPCGREDRYASICAHRKGYRKRPECAAGKIYPVDPTLLDKFKDGPPDEDDDTESQWMSIDDAARHLGISRRGVKKRVERGRIPFEDRAGETYVDVVGQTVREGDEGDEGDEEETDAGEPDAADAPGDVPPIVPPRPTATVLAGTGSGDDPEEIARRYNAAQPAPQRMTVIDRGLMSLEDVLSGAPTGADLPPGDWRLDQPPGAPPPSQAKETVQLPVIVRLMYDYLRGQGWHEGDGNLSAFITSIVLDYWENVLGLKIVVIDAEEIEHGGGTVDGGLPNEGEPRQAAAVSERPPGGGRPPGRGTR